MAGKLDSVIRKLRLHDLLDGVTFKTREHVGVCILSACDVLDDNRVLEQRRKLATDARAGFKLF